ncbi:MAG TPA: hypothetical protein VL179_00390 [Mycobacterium sp.]|nr:hypothetical protein [Mycobacterium sp.]
MQNIAKGVLEAPFPVLQQVLVNNLGPAGYTTQLAAALHDIGAAQFSFLTGSGVDSLQGSLSSAFGSIAGGKFGDGLFFLMEAGLIVVSAPFAIGQALSQVPVAVAGEIVAGGTALNGSLFESVERPLLHLPVGQVLVLGNSLQGVYNGVSGGKAADALTALVNIPANLTGAFLNGEHTMLNGLLGGEYPLTNPGLLPGLLVLLPRRIAEAIGWNGAGAPLDAMGGPVGLLQAPVKILSNLLGS